MIELLVAAAITAVLAGLMLALVGNVLTGWNRSRGTLTTESQARIVLDRLAQDLQGALYRNDGNAWLVATVEDNTDTSGLWVPANASPKPSSNDPTASRDTLSDSEKHLLGNARFGIAGVWLQFIAAVSTATSGQAIPGTSPAVAEPNSPVAVAYQLIRRTPNDTTGSAHYMLFRSEIAPSVTFNGGYNLDANSTAPAPAPATYLNTFKQPDKSSVIADNVIDFGVWLYARDPSTGALTLIFPTATNAAAPYLAKSPAASTSATDRFPEVADVMVRVLTDEGVRQIQALESGQTSGGDWWTIAIANSRVFTRRIELHPGPL